MDRSKSTLALLFLLAVTAVTLLFVTVDPWLNTVGILVGGLDAHIYRDGAFRLLHDQSLYDEPTFLGLLYTYTPFSAVAFLPTQLIPWRLLTPVWMGLNVAALFGVVLLSWRLLGYRLSASVVGSAALLTLSCAFLEPVRTTLYFGQINIMLMLLVLWDFSRAERSRLRGIGVGIAAGIKLVPLYFVLEYAALRQWRAMATAAGTFVLTVVGTALILPADSRRYWTSIFFQSGRIAPDEHPSNQSLRGTIAHLAGGPAPMWLWVLVAGLVLAAGLWLSVALYRRGEKLLAIVLAGLTACAISPFSWGHHWVWFIPLLVYLVHRAQRSAWWWAAAAGLYLAIAAWPYQYTPTWISVGTFLLPPYWPGAQLLMNAYILTYLVVLAALGALVWRGRPRPGTEAAGSATPTAEPDAVAGSPVLAAAADVAPDAAPEPAGRGANAEAGVVGATGPR
ncbi:glycosyltransferase 87 family protein [Nocardia thailandica]